MPSIKQLVGWFIFVVVLTFLWKSLSLPDEIEIRIWLDSWLDTYGLRFLFVGALFESLFLLGFYFPGSLLIFVSVASAATKQEATILISVVSMGVMIGHCINYLLGRFGWYKLLVKAGLQNSIETAQRRVKKSDFTYILLTYWNPALASVTATACGIVKLSPYRFLILSAIGICLWNTFWGILVYSLGDRALSLISTQTILLVLSGLILMTLIHRYLLRTKIDRVQ